MDHVEYIGPTLADIAAEKAGIVEPGAALVLGETDPALVPYFLAREPGSVAIRDRDFGVRVEPPRRRRPRARPVHAVRNPRRGLPRAARRAPGRQRARSRSPRWSRSSVARSATSSSPTRSATCETPGRLEVVGHQPLVLLDGVKNVAGAHALRVALAEEFADSPRTLVVGLMREKEPHEMLDALGVVDAARLVCCRPDSPRGLDPEVVADAAYDLGVDRERRRGDRRRARRGRVRGRHDTGRRPGRDHRLALRREPGARGSRPRITLK